MTRSIPLRTDYNANDLRRLSRNSSKSKQIRRLLALALIYDGNAARGGQGSTNPLSLDIRCHLSGPRCGSCSRSAHLQHRWYEPASERNIPCCHAWGSCHYHRRSGWVALLKGFGNSRQHHRVASAPAITGTQPSRKCLAVHAR